MKEVNVDKLKICANKLLFDMEEKEFISYLEEFKDILYQMEIMGKDKSIDELEPLIFPIDVFTNSLREDIPSKTLDRKEGLKNAKNVVAGQIKISKVVS